ncbi:MAG: hypothetical protein WAO91_01260 [Candidatus Nitrosotenuis sp.]
MNRVYGLLAVVPDLICIFVVPYTIPPISYQKEKSMHAMMGNHTDIGAIAK